MPESGSRAGVFEAVGAVALLFMVIGIAIAVIQWIAYAEDPTPVPRGIDPPSKLRLAIEHDEGEADAGAGGAEAPAPDDDSSKPDKDAEGDDDAPAKKGEEEMEF